MHVRPLTRAEVRSIDRRAAEDLGLPTLVLMENAGRGAAELLTRQLTAGSTGRVAIACGSGNNGGDGGVVARHLDAWGFAVSVVWFASPDRLAADAATQYRILERSGISQQAYPTPPASIEALFHSADWIVDGLLGTGLTRPVESPFREVIDAMNRSGKPILALDLPSGLDCDTGLPQGRAVQATLTASFVAPKIGFDRPEAHAFTGAVHVVDIGVPRCLLRPFIKE